MTKPEPARPGLLRRIWTKIRAASDEQHDLNERRRGLQSGAHRYGTFGTGDSGRYPTGF